MPRHGLRCGLLRQRNLGLLSLWGRRSGGRVAGHGQSCGHRRRQSTNVPLSSCLAVVLVAFGRQVAWRPGASHDIHIFPFDLIIHRCWGIASRDRRWHRLVRLLHRLPRPHHSGELQQQFRVPHCRCKAQEQAQQGCVSRCFDSLNYSSRMFSSRIKMSWRKSSTTTSFTCSVSWLERQRGGVGRAVIWVSRRSVHCNRGSSSVNCVMISSSVAKCSCPSFGASVCGKVSMTDQYDRALTRLSTAKDHHLPTVLSSCCL